MNFRLDPQPIPGLNTWKVAHVASTGSTNADLLDYAKSDPEADQIWLTAGEQLAGRGRRGRSWHSPTGNLHASMFLRDPSSVSDLGFFPLVCAVAMHRAVSSAIAPLANHIQIKWPNDILVDGAKCCGMLLESEHLNGDVMVVVGCGINLVAHPDDTPYPANHLNALGAGLSPRDMFHHLAEAFAFTLGSWNRGANNGDIHQYWQTHARGIGEPITVNLESGKREGLFEGINRAGHMLLRDASGDTEKISAGDVFFPHMSK